MWGLFHTAWAKKRLLHRSKVAEISTAAFFSLAIRGIVRLVCQSSHKSQPTSAGHTGYEWLCRLRRDYSANSDVWVFRNNAMSPL